MKDKENTEETKDNLESTTQIIVSDTEDMPPLEEIAKDTNNDDRNEPSSSTNTEQGSTSLEISSNLESIIFQNDDSLEDSLNRINLPNSTDNEQEKDSDEDFGEQPNDWDESFEEQTNDSDKNKEQPIGLNEDNQEVKKEEDTKKNDDEESSTTSAEDSDTNSFIVNITGNPNEMNKEEPLGQINNNEEDN
jgi:hypothetical protein